MSTTAEIGAYIGIFCGFVDFFLADVVINAKENVETNGSLVKSVIRRETTESTLVPD